MINKIIWVNSNSSPICERYSSLSQTSSIQAWCISSACRGWIRIVQAPFVLSLGKSRSTAGMPGLNFNGSTQIRLNIKQYIIKLWSIENVSKVFIWIIIWWLMYLYIYGNYVHVCVYIYIYIYTYMDTILNLIIKYETRGFSWSRSKSPPELPVITAAKFRLGISYRTSEGQCQPVRKHGSNVIQCM